ncbi:hypothetical protein H8702_13180 [Massilimaliae timonensis]|uniref:Uncharacterized protein n=1 Tax=Massiliimalia timonensis TaxID=1987501 RepID=A0A8J6P9Z0_9FIRM|nr:hypothetical protein [Massiliimalia timonensis]MBC8612044.1 hypothetical protein [Massiliimalia timonensis]
MVNSRAKIILYLSYIIILAGLLLGFIFSISLNDIIYLLLVGLSSIVVGVLLMGFSEIIELLQKIYDQKTNISLTETVSSGSTEITDTGSKNNEIE